MHMADALLAPAVAATMYVASASAAGVSIHQLKKDDEPQKLPVMAVTSALVFAGQMINYTIPGTGSSGHMCGGMMLSALLGPYAGFLSMIVILAIQCLFFADGGLMALGANCWNMNGPGGQLLEHGFLRVLRRLLPDLASDNERQVVRRGQERRARTHNRGVDNRLHNNLAIGSFFGGA